MENIWVSFHAQGCEGNDEKRRFLLNRQGGERSA